MMKLLILSTLVFFQFQILMASYYPGYIIDHQNNRHNGYIQMFKGFDKVIILKEDLKGSKKEFKSVDLRIIGLYSENIKDTVIYTRHNAARYVIGAKLKIDDDKMWAHQIYKSDKIEGYFMPNTESDVINTPGSRNINSYQVFEGFVKLPTDNYLVHVFTNFGDRPLVLGGHKTMRTMFKYAVKKACPLIEEKLDKEKYKMEEFIKMLEGYTEFCK